MCIRCIPIGALQRALGRTGSVNCFLSETPVTLFTGVADTLAALKEQGFKGAFCVQTARGSGQELMNNLATVLNRFSDVVTKLASGVR